MNEPEAKGSTVSTDREAAIHAWASAFEGLTPDTLDGLVALAHPDIRFKDPFNDVVGRTAFRRVFEDMFDTCIDPGFEILDIAISETAGYVRWRFTFRPRALRGRPLWTMDGMSEVSVDGEGFVTAHIDHWDAASGLLGRLPFVGAFVRFLLRRLSVN